MLFNLDFTHLCLDIPVGLPSINTDFIIIIIIIKELPDKVPDA